MRAVVIVAVLFVGACGVQPDQPLPDSSHEDGAHAHDIASCGRLVVTPAACDYGVVAAGAQGECDLSFTNAGTAALSITGLHFVSSTENTFQAQGVFVLPTILEPDTGVTVPFTSAPTQSSYSDTLVISSDDCNDAEHPVTFSVGASST